MLSKLKSFGLEGIDGFLVEIETDIVGGVPHFEIVGLGDKSVKEAKDRVKSAIRNSGFEYPLKHFTINLAPADVKKEGPIYDLGIAVGILSASEQIKKKNYKDYIFLGELSLDGTIKKVRGVLPMLISARSQGYRRVIIPKENIEEASFIDNMEIYAFSKLTEVVEFLDGLTEENFRVQTKSFEEVALKSINKPPAVGEERKRCQGRVPAAQAASGNDACSEHARSRRGTRTESAPHKGIPHPSQNASKRGIASRAGSAGMRQTYANKR